MIEPSFEPSPARARRFRKRWIAWAFLAAWVSVGAWGTFKPMPPGTNVATAPVELRQSQVDFLWDLTSADGYGRAVHEQSIFERVFEIIDEAESFVVADFFLLNDMMGATSDSHRALSREFADRLIARKQAKPELAVLLITDPINEVYGGAPSALLQALESAGIDVVLTDLDRMRDSNPGYSALWRMFVSWWGNAPTGGRMLNPFTTDASGITLRSWLALLNFKANHRKLIVADRGDGRLTALVTSANPHDASSAHSNVALELSGPLAGEIVASEMAIARFSGWRGHIYTSTAPARAPGAGEPTVEVAFLTEAAIGEHLSNAIETTRNGDVVRIAMFYLSDRKVIEALLAAARRGVIVRLILDPNRDAFGRQKDGVPNRPVANELVSESDGRIEVRWYRTHGEQFHTKLVLITQGDRLIASLGSANLTRRNLRSYNLEANVALEMAADSPLAAEMLGFFDRLWSNEAPPGTEFTAAFGAYRDEDRGRYWRYRVMEATGLSTF
jgi:phosphatidylserine/phosphatidylglycerophosphate/cardiolipin synthase-like enzyme